MGETSYQIQVLALLVSLISSYLSRIFSSHYSRFRNVEISDGEDRKDFKSTWGRAESLDILIEKLLLTPVGFKPSNFLYTARRRDVLPSHTNLNVGTLTINELDRSEQDTCQLIWLSKRLLRGWFPTGTVRSWSGKSNYQAKVCVLFPSHQSVTLTYST